MSPSETASLLQIAIRRGEKLKKRMEKKKGKERKGKIKERIIHESLPTVTQLLQVVHLCGQK